MTAIAKLRLAALGAGLGGLLSGLPAQAGAPDATGSAAATPSRQQNVGFFSGLTIGAAAGGPVGALVGATAGALLGERYHRQQEKSHLLTVDLSASEAQRAQLTAQVAQLDGSLRESRELGAQLGNTLQQADQIGLDVNFRTDDDGIAAQAMPPLLKLGALVASVPQARLHVDGYADPRGPAAYNQELSLRRARSVAAALGAAGVPAERITITGHGADDAPECGDADADDYALERRVSVRVELPASGQVATR